MTLAKTKGRLYTMEWERLDVLYQEFLNRYKATDSGREGKALELAIRSLLQPSSNRNGRITSPYSFYGDMVLYGSGNKNRYQVEIKSSCCELATTATGIENALSKSNIVFYVQEIFSDVPLAKQIRVVEKQEFLEFLQGNPTLIRVKKPTLYYSNNSSTVMVTMQSFYSESRPKASRKSRKLIDEFLCQYPLLPHWYASIKR